jgi:hypothetical protein
MKVLRYVTGPKFQVPVPYISVAKIACVSGPWPAIHRLHQYSLLEVLKTKLTSRTRIPSKVRSPRFHTRSLSLGTWIGRPENIPNLIIEAKSRAQNIAWINYSLPSLSINTSLISQTACTTYLY